MALHYPFTAKHTDCKECDREYEPPQSNCVHRIGMGGICPQCAEPTDREQAREPQRVWLDAEDCCDDELGAGTYYTHKPSVASVEYVSTSALSSRDAEIREAVAAQIPTNWLDPLLSGPNAVIGRPPYDCRHIEALLRAVKERISTAPVAPQPPQPLSRPPRRRSRKQQVEEELKASDITATLAERENIIYGPHDSLPQCGDHVARIRKK